MSGGSEYVLRGDSEKMLKVGMIGLGSMGRVHMMNCLHMDNIKIVAVADASKRALKKAESVGVKNLYTDYHDLLNDSLDLDAVIIVLPNFLHFESIQLALEVGLNVFVEKPMANTVKECQKIVKLVKSSGRKLMVGHYMRFIDVIEKMKKTADKGHIGNLEVITLEEVTHGPFTHPTVPKPVPDWWFTPEKIGGGVVLDLGCHLIDLFRFFVGDAKILYSCLDHRLNLSIEDEAIIILNSSSSCVKGIINVGWYEKSNFPYLNFRAILHGNAGHISSDKLGFSNVYFHAIKEGTKNIFRRMVRKKIRPLSYSQIYEAYYKEMRHFFNCLEQDNAPSISATDGLKTIEIIEDIYKSHDKTSSWRTDKSV